MPLTQELAEKSGKFFDEFEWYMTALKLGREKERPTQAVAAGYTAAMLLRAVAVLTLLIPTGQLAQKGNHHASRNRNL